MGALKFSRLGHDPAQATNKAGLQPSLCDWVAGELEETSWQACILPLMAALFARSLLRKNLNGSLSRSLFGDLDRFQKTASFVERFLVFEFGYAVRNDSCACLHIGLAAVDD